MSRCALERRPIGITLILLQKTLWGLGLCALAIVLLSMVAAHVTQPFQILFADELAEDPHDLVATLAIGLVPAISLQTELLLAFGAGLYAVLEGIEVWGLWRGLHWVEMLIVVETAALLPYELWELTRAPSTFKALSLALNVVIVWYLAARYRGRRAAHGARLPAAAGGQAYSEREVHVERLVH